MPSGKNSDPTTRPDRGLPIDMNSVISVIENSNQRGGRMFSVVDLIEAGTLSIGQTAWLADRILHGSSWLVGASPGGAGKTTIMSALLGLVPPCRAIRLTCPGTGWKNCGPGDCVVAYEIGAGPYHAYIWGEALRTFARLASHGVRCVSNLHADTLDEARHQIVTQNGADPVDFAHFDLFLPIRLSRHGFSMIREVQEVNLAEAGGWTTVSRQQAEERANPRTLAFLEATVADGCREVREFRARWLRFIATSALGGVRGDK